MKASNSRFRPRLISALVSLLFVCPGAFAASDAPLSKLGNARRIVFLGDSITYAGNYVEAIEAYCVTRFPDREFEFINVGLSSETVSGASEPGHAGGRYPRPNLHQRLDQILEKVKPDLVFACYGMNDGIYHPPAPERLEAFQQGIRLLREKAAAANARIIHITPPVFDPVPIPQKTTNTGPFSFARPYFAYDETLAAFSDWLTARRSADWEVVNLHNAMARWVAEERKRDRNFVFATDGVHPNANGHWFMAKQVLMHLGATEVAGISSAAALVSANPAGDEILNLIREKQQLLRDAWLMEVGHTRPGVKEGLPIAEAQAKASALDRRIRELARLKRESGPINAAPGH